MRIWKRAGRWTAVLALVGAGVVAGFALATAPAASGMMHQEVAQTSAAADDMAAMVPQGQFVTVAEQTAPTVVFIEAERPARRSATSRFDDFFENFFDRRPHEDQPEDDGGFEPLQASQGSGVLVSADGYILTNAHVVSSVNIQTQGEDLATAVHVTLQDESYYEAEIVGVDLGTDIALLKIDAEALPYARIGDSDEIRVGEWVMAVGAPFGLQNTVSAGIVSALGRGSLAGMNTPYQDFIQTDAAINPGNSGGPLVNLHGEVIGINTAIATGGGLQPAFAGVGFAVPANLARRVMEQLRDTGRVVRGYLGVTVQPLGRDEREAWGLSPQTRGAIINSVVGDGPAEAAGLHVSDIVVELDGHRLRSQQDFLQRIANHVPGDEVRLGIIRDGQRMDITVTLTERPEEASIIAGQLPSLTPREREPEEETGPDTSSIRSLGLDVTDLTPRLRQQLRIGEDIDGVVISGVQDNSPAARIGLGQGDVIRRVKSTPVTSVSEFVSAMSEYGPGDVVALYVYSRQRGASFFLTMRIPNP